MKGAIEATAFFLIRQFNQAVHFGVEAEQQGAIDERLGDECCDDYDNIEAHARADYCIW